MLYGLKNLNLASSILRIEIVDNKIYILNNKFTLLIYCNETYALLDKLVLLDSQENKHLYDNSLAISQNLDIYYSHKDSNIGSLFQLHNGKIKQSPPIELHTKNVTYARFSRNSKFLLIGVEDGRTCFYNLEHSKSCFSLDARSDSITSAAFSHSDKLVCVGAFDKAVYIYDITQHKAIDEIKLTDTPEDLLFSDYDANILGITRDNQVFSYNLEDKEVSYADTRLDEWPTAMIRMGSHHVLVGTKGDILYIFNIHDLSLVRRFRVDNAGVSSLKIRNDILYIGYTNGEIKIIDTNYLHSEFEENLKMNKFAKATSFIKDNIFLMTKETAIKYDIVWDKVLHMAKDMLVSKGVENTEKMIKPFLWDKRKKFDYTRLKVNLPDVKHLESLIEQDNHVIAYKFADQKEYLQTVKAYEVMETSFDKKFQIAKNLFSKESRQDIQNAKNMLSPYLKIDSKQTLINSLIENYKVFARSYRLIKARNFKVYFRLVEKNIFLKDEKLYSRIIEIGNQTYSLLLQLEQAGNYQQAEQVIEYLQDFLPFNEKITEVQDTIESKKNLVRLIKENDVKSIYDKIAISTKLEVSSIFTRYHEMFEEKKEKATLYASEGESTKVMQTLEEHLNIEYLLNTIAMVFKLSYLVEIEKVIQSNPDNINMHATLERYSLLFGIDDDLQFLAKKLQFSQVLPESSSNTIGYKTNKFYENIVVVS